MAMHRQLPPFQVDCGHQTEKHEGICARNHAASKINQLMLLELILSRCRKRRSQVHRCIPHLTCGTNFLLLFLFLVSSVHHHHPALLYRHTLILDRLLTFLVAFSTLVLKLSISPSLSLHSHLSLPFLRLISWNYDHSLFGSHWRCNIVKCGRLSQPLWLLVRTVI